jgi:hypothetical protein
MNRTLKPHAARERHSMVEEWFDLRRAADKIENDEIYRKYFGV